MHSIAMSIGNRALVLKEFALNYNGPVYVHIVARSSGLISWFLTMLGIDVTTTFEVYADRIEFKRGSLSGQIQTILPLRSISVTSTGYTKPILFFAFALFFFLIGLFMLPAMMVHGGELGIFVFCAWMIGLACILFYFLNKSLLIAVVSHSGLPAAICFKRSVIEGVGIGSDQAQEVINIITQLLMQQTSK